jgi:hypothetical protein
MSPLAKAIKNLPKTETVILGLKKAYVIDSSEVLLTRPLVCSENPCWKLCEVASAYPKVPIVFTVRVSEFFCAQPYKDSEGISLWDKGHSPTSDYTHIITPTSRYRRVFGLDDWSC